MQCSANMLQGFTTLTFSQSIDLLFRVFQNLSRCTQLLIHSFRYIRSSICQPPEHCFFPDDIGIPLRIGGGRRDLHQLQNIAFGIILIMSQFFHLIQHGNRIDGLREIKHRVDRFIDLTVLLEIKILRTNNADHIVQASGIDKDRSKDCLFCL